MTDPDQMTLADAITAEADELRAENERLRAASWALLSEVSSLRAALERIEQFGRAGGWTGNQCSQVARAALARP